VLVPKYSPGDLMIKTYLFTKSEVSRDAAVEDWRELTKGDCSLLWVDVRSATEEDMSKLAECFGLHAIAVESCMDHYRRPHLYEFDDHFYVNMTMLRETRTNHGVKPHELHLFVGGKFILSVTKDSDSEAVDQALKEYVDTPGLCARGPMYAVYLLAEDLIDTYYPIVNKLDESADKLENDMLQKTHKGLLKRNLDLKHEVFELRRVLGPQRDVLNDLSRRDFAFIEGEASVYFQDVYNRMIRVFDMLDTIREILTSNFDIYLASVSNRLNDIMKVLTILAVIIGVFSFITGFLGMNMFEPIRKPLGDVVAWSAGVGVAITAALLYLFRRTGWL